VCREAEGYRRLHAGLTALWLDTAEAIGASIGHIVHDWSLERVWDLAQVPDDACREGCWPRLLGWWTYLGAVGGKATPPPPLAQFFTSDRALPSGARVVALLDDPAAVDERRYEEFHEGWLTHLAA
jgi:hypothetical protein